MNLRDYMHFNRLTQKQMSEILGIAPNYIGAIARGERVPSERLAELIEIKLKGQVTAKEIFKYCLEISNEEILNLE